MRVKYYQVYENGDKDMIMVHGSHKEADRRRHIGRGSVELDVEVNDAKGLEDLRKKLEDDWLQKINADRKKKNEEMVKDISVTFSFSSES